MEPLINNYVVSCMLPCMFCGVYVFYYQDLLYVILSKLQYLFLIRLYM